MPNPPIQIYSGNTTTGYLHTSDAGRTEVKQGEHISWILGPGNVLSFHIVGKSSGNIFTATTIPTNNGTRLDLDVRSNAPLGEWKYSIEWIDKGIKKSHTYDPKISVNPKFNLSFIAIIMGLLVSAFIIFRITRNRISKSK